MLKLKPLDENVSIAEQLGEDVSPVLLINLFEVAAQDISALLDACEADSDWMKSSVGTCPRNCTEASQGARLHDAVWDSSAHFRAAFNHPDFRDAMTHCTSSTVASPHCSRDLPCLISAWVAEE